ncbi:calcium-binding protein [Fulvimarina sp. MAC8]|uniref:calcium-binding protein n=1 Tax=Fulvimarina sp. MAC8 TaxID=3162874 RepID=UPI0032EF9678
MLQNCATSVSRKGKSIAIRDKKELSFNSILPLYSAGALQGDHTCHSPRTLPPRYPPEIPISSRQAVFPASDNSNYYLAGSTSTAANNSFFTRNGSDILKGFDGNDTLFSGGGRDIVEGGGDNDFISGEGGDDFLYGDYRTESPFASGDDSIHGGAGNDYLFGAGGDDQLYGGTGNDTLEGGTGSDLLRGDSGSDTFVFDFSTESLNSDDIDTIIDFSSTFDTIIFTNTPADIEYIPIDASVYGGEGTIVVAYSSSEDLSTLVYLQNFYG